MEEWHFVLVGDIRDINGIVDLFAAQGTITEDEHGQTTLILHLDHAGNQYTAAENAADALLAQMNAVVQIVHGDHQNVHIGAYGHKDESTGVMTYFLDTRDGIRSHARIGLGSVYLSTDGPPDHSKKYGDQLPKMASSNEHLQRAFYLYGSIPLDWRGLYMVLEAAEDGNGGEKGLIKKRWVADGQIKNFKATANSYLAIGNQARHGTVNNAITKPKQTLEDARSMVRTILEKWSKGIS